MNAGEYIYVCTDAFLAIVLSSILSFPHCQSCCEATVAQSQQSGKYVGRWSRVPRNKTSLGESLAESYA